MRPDIAWSRSFPVPRTHCLPRRATPSCPTAMFDNARMLALVRRRGYITLHRDKFSDMRMAIGAAQPARLRQRGNP